MRLIVVPLALFLLAGCLEVKVEKRADEKVSCFEVIDMRDDPSMLLNRCTGETWIALQKGYPEDKEDKYPSYSWRWYKVERYSDENIVAGIKLKKP